MRTTREEEENVTGLELVTRVTGFCFVGNVIASCFTFVQQHGGRLSTFNTTNN